MKILLNLELVLVTAFVILFADVYAVYTRIDLPFNILLILRDELWNLRKFYHLP